MQGIILSVLILLSSFSICQAQIQGDCSKEYKYEHPIPFQPEKYNAKKIIHKIFVDGKMDEEEWGNITWSNDFVDIEGDLRPKPERQTRLKMVYDDEYLYIAAKLEEDHLWYTLTNKDDIIFYDDDFEVFIDPDGDGHNYLEIEMNEYNAVWDLFLMFPYRITSKHNYIMNWEVKGMKTAVHLEGTVNDPSDKDEYWSVEIAIPWSAMLPFASNEKMPSPGDYWRIDFSRVDWLMNIEDNNYKKQVDKEGKVLPERNWVWSATGYINMHRPEDWGYLFFDAGDSLDLPKVESFKRIMWGLYHSVRAFRAENGSYPENLECIETIENNLGLKKNDFKYFGGTSTFEIIGDFEGDKWVLAKDGHLRKLSR